MRVTLEKAPIGHGERLFHVSIYCDDHDQGSMYLVASDTLAKALYLAWVQHYDDTEFFNLERCDGYLVGHVERSL